MMMRPASLFCFWFLAGSTSTVFIQHQQACLGFSPPPQTSTLNSRIGRTIYHPGRCCGRFAPFDQHRGRIAGSVTTAAGGFNHNGHKEENKNDFKFASSSTATFRTSFASKQQPYYHHNNKNNDDAITGKRSSSSVVVLSMASTKINTVFNRCWESTGKSLGDLCSGATYVHNHYLELWGKMCQKLKYLIPIWVLFFAGTMVFPNVKVIRFPSESVRSVLEKLMIVVQIPTEFVFKVFVLPFHFIMSLIRISIRGELSISKSVNVAKILLSELRFSDQPPDSELLCFGGTIDYLLSTIVIVPLLEELGMRFTFSRLWRWVRNKRSGSMAIESLSNNNNNNNNNNTETEQNDDNRAEDNFQAITTTKLIDRLSTWALASSIIFAGAHLANHLPAPSTATVAAQTVKFQNDYRRGVHNRMKKEGPLNKDLMRVMDFGETLLCRSIDKFSRYDPVFSAMIQAIVAFTFSLTVLCPIFISNGIMGAFGAHAAWNLFACGGIGGQIILRLLVRKFRKKIQENTGASSSEQKQE